MKLCNMKVLNAFVAAVNQCKGAVWLESPEGDKFNLKSQFSQYIALGALLSNHGGSLELFCSDPNDEALFYQFLYNNPEARG